MGLFLLLIGDVVDEKGQLLWTHILFLLPDAKKGELLPELRLAALTPEPIPLETCFCQVGLLGGERRDAAFLPSFLLKFLTGISIRVKPEGSCLRRL